MKVFDLHEDISSYIIHERKVEDFKINANRHADIPKYFLSKTKAIVAAVFPSQNLVDEPMGKRYYSFKNSFNEALNHILTYYRFVRKYDVFKIVENKRFLAKLFSGNEGKIGLILGLEGAYPLREPYEIELFYKLGVRVLGLTWNVDNQYAASCMSKKDYGLTGPGESLVNLALEQGMVIDLAHASEKTAIDVLSISEKPVIISHAGLRRFNNSLRNVSDEVLELLKRNRGAIGIFFVSEYIKGNNTTINDVVDQIIYLKENYGIDIVALGTDFFGTEKLPKGLEHIGKLTLLAKELAKAGLTESEVEKIFYANALRVFLENMK